MMVKEWSVDNNGRPVATWVECERVSPLQSKAAEFTGQATDSCVPAADPSKTGIGASRSNRVPPAAADARKAAEPRSHSKLGNFIRLYAIVRTILA
jgi:hypothetical protein